MADSLNPFGDSDATEVEIDDDNDFVSDFPPRPTQVQRQEGIDISWDSIAAKLLRDNYILTALELYTEFIESGRDLPRLRDFFSNPGNFERTKEDLPSPTLPRTSSVQTFDSLDFARYSDDGERQVDERVAVLEFELRKAQETIKSLRASLTQQAETELSTPENQYKGGLGGQESDTITPVEKKALNFLVNEYLLQANYKVTSVTFAEENEEQDFEDWDDVGLNIPRPPGLVHLFKDYSSHVAPNKEMTDVGVGVDFQKDEFNHLETEWKSRIDILESQLISLDKKLKISNQENEILAQQVEILKIGSTRESLHQSNTVTPSQRSDTNVEPGPKFGRTSSTGSANGPLPASASQTGSSHRNRSEETHVEHDQSSSPGVIDIVDSSLSNNVMGEREEGEGQEEVEGGTTLTTLVAPREELVSNHSQPENSILDHSKPLVQDHNSSELKNRQMTSTFRKALLDVAFHVSQDNRIVSEMSKISHSDVHGVVKMLARCLPHIVPNVLLAKREELIPVILCTAILHPDP
ncbi:unnamed protein product, partial [Lymnaea stagnalis]